MKNLTLLIFLLLFNCLHIHHYQHLPKTEERPEKKKELTFKSWEDVLKDTKFLPGFLKVHLKRDNTLFLELSASDFEKDFGLVMHISYGLGDLDVIEGLPISDTRLLRFRRIGDKVYLIHRNARFKASRKEFTHFVEENVGHSVIASFKIESENEKNKNILINLTDFLVSDYPDLVNYLEYFYKSKSVKFNKSNSTIYKIKNFPENTEVDVMLCYDTSEYPLETGEGISDYRFLTIGIRFSFYKLPDTPMRPRYADERVGYFIEAVMDFDREKEESPFVRMITRWRLEKKDNSKEISEPVKPITFYLDKSIPEEYRKFVREGVLAWNEAFEEAGFKNAIVVKDAPDDPNWDPEDIRYSTIRWVSAREMGYAIGPSQVDPRTGEILNADILISASFVRGWLSDYQELVDPLKFEREIKEVEDLDTYFKKDNRRDRLCFYEKGLRHQIGFLYTVLESYGIVQSDNEFPIQYIGDAIRDLVMHEVGHTLGLKHNFRASSSIPFEKLNDTSFTRKHGLTISVMDYTPVNISSDPKKQGDFWNKKVGEYDKWAIKFGYAPCYKQKDEETFAKTGELVESPEEEVKYLKKIAKLNVNPFYTYGSDEDASLLLGVDPLTTRWDLSSDLLKYAQERLKIVENVLPKLENFVIKEDQSYSRLRNAFLRVNYERYLALLHLVKFLGGVYFNRFHKGEKEPPLRPVPSDIQRKAFEFLRLNIFSKDAFKFDGKLLNKLSPDRWVHWGMWETLFPIDFPIHSYVLSIQRRFLDLIFYPPRLHRIVDNRVKILEEKPFELTELFESLTQTIFEEIFLVTPENVNSFRRNLQKIFTEKLGEILLGKFYPQDANSLSRYELQKIKTKIEQIIDNKELDQITKAHFIELKEKIKRYLEASLFLPF
ncbi:MAG: zinc-dependent metalloprotease [Candidatus Hydrothermales bacterium]